MSFSRSIWPSNCPLLQGSVRADRTAAASPSNPEANVAIAGAVQAFAVVVQVGSCSLCVDGDRLTRVGDG